MKQQLPEGMMPAAIAGLSLIGVTIAGTIGACTLLTRCARPAPIPMQTTDTAATASVGVSQIANQSIKLTIRRPIPANPSKTTAYKGQEGGIATIPGVVGPIEVQNGATGLLDGNGAIGPDFEEIVVEMSQNLESRAAATSSSELSSSVSSKNPSSEFSRLGVMLSSAPGSIALTYQALELGPLGVDLEINHRQAGIGVSSKGKLFGIGGAYLEQNGSRGSFAGAGIRF